MKYNRIYVNGCSYSCAYGLNWEKTKEFYKNNMGVEILNHLDYSYPTLLANKLNVEIVNDAIPGGSIPRMIRTTYEYLIKNENTYNKTLFILEIPPGWRDEFFSNELKRTINITIGNIHFSYDKTEEANGFNIMESLNVIKELRKYFYNFVNVEYDTFKCVTQLIGLFSYLKQNKIEFYIIDNGIFENFLKNNKIKEKYDFIKFNDMYLYDFIDAAGLTISLETGGNINDSHAGVNGNKIIAEMIYNKIKNIKIENNKNLL
jgi:hypothetical protein